MEYTKLSLKRSLLLGLFVVGGSLIYAQSLQVNLNLQKVSLKKVFSTIESQTPYHFSYLDADISNRKDVTIRAKKQKVSDVLNSCLDSRGLAYDMVSDKSIIVYKKKNPRPNKSQQVRQTEKEGAKIVTSGLVTDATGEPLIGVTVKNRATGDIAVTDVDGRYSIDTNSAETSLEFSYVGFKPRILRVKGHSKINVSMEEDNNELNDVVVVGYGTQRKVDLTGAVVSVSNKDLVKTPSSNLTDALQGRLPGLNIKKNSDEPGSFNSNFNIRGLGSPLIIVDGIARSNFDRIDPNEIESISVLKDASAAVYGVRAANGVILVTTRHGEAGKTDITLDASYGVKQVTRFPKGVDAYGYMDLYNEAMANRGETVPTFDHDLIQQGSPYANVNWYDEIVRKSAPQQRYNVTASGGNDRLQFFSSIGYYKEEGLWKTKSLDYQRYNIRTNVTAKITNRLKTSFEFGGYYDLKNSPAYYPADIFKAIGAVQPIYEIYANGNPAYIGYQSNDDFNALIKSSPELSGYRQTKNYQVNLTASLTWDIPWIKGLSAKGLVSFDPFFHNDKLFSKQYHTYTYDKATDSYNVKTTSAMSRITEWRNSSSSPTTQLSLNYEGRFDDKHTVKGLLLFETHKYERSELSGARNTLMDAVDQIYAGLNDDARDINSSADRYSNAGLVGRVDYDYLSRYIAQVSFRYDGSSRFHNKRWGFFPSLSLGWRISEEIFFKDALPFVDNLKIRGSIGKMGDDSADSYLWLSAFSYPGGDKYLLGDATVVPGVGMPEIANPNATWYTATTKNIGIDLSMWNSALTISFDIFRRDRDGLLASKSVSVPGTFGATFSQENINSDMNYGFELVVGSQGSIGQVTYNVSSNLTFTQSRNKHIQSAAFGNSYENWRNNRNDRNNNMLWMYKAIGQFTNTDQVYLTPVLNGTYNQYDYLPGDLIYQDYNEDGIIDNWDRQPLARGNMPVMNYGLALNVAWKGVDWSVSFQGASMFNSRLNIGPLIWSGSAWNIFMDRWHKEDPYDPNGEWIPGHYPTTRIHDPQNYGTESNFWYNRCSYLRLKNIEVGYTFPHAWAQWLGMKSLRAYVNGYNLLTFQSKASKYADPENPGGQLSSYPIMKNFNIGVNVKF